jgi:hypothetical protein
MTAESQYAGVARDHESGLVDPIHQRRADHMGDKTPKRPPKPKKPKKPA